MNYTGYMSLICCKNSSQFLIGVFIDMSSQCLYKNSSRWLYTTSHREPFTILMRFFICAQNPSMEFVCVPVTGSTNSEEWLIVWWCDDNCMAITDLPILLESHNLSTCACFCSPYQSIFYAESGWNLQRRLWTASVCDGERSDWSCRGHFV